MSNPILWANMILVVHFIFVLAILVPIPLIIVGGFFRWKFISNPWFRHIHLVLIGIVVLETVFGLLCPLTVWEQQLRALGGQTTYQNPFLSYWISRLLYYNFPQWIFAVAYIALAGFIVMLYFIFPPRRKYQRK